MKFSIGINPGDIVRLMDGREGVVEQATGTTAYVTIIEESEEKTFSYQILCSKKRLKKVYKVDVWIQRLRKRVIKTIISIK